jgi:hypothetical protein
MIGMDMSEYMEKHAVARLTGPPPGYIGYVRYINKSRPSLLYSVAKFCFHLTRVGGRWSADINGAE